jgi:hypothetical protein
MDYSLHGESFSVIRRFTSLPQLTRGVPQQAKPHRQARDLNSPRQDGARFARIARQQQPGRDGVIHPGDLNRADPMQRFNPDQRQEFERISLVYREILLRVACGILRSESLGDISGFTCSLILPALR